MDKERHLDSDSSTWILDVDRFPTQPVCLVAELVQRNSIRYLLCPCRHVVWHLTSTERRGSLLWSEKGRDRAPRTD